MNLSHDLGVEAAGRLAVTAVPADLEYWARSVSLDGRIHVDALVDVLEALRAASTAARRAPALPWASRP